MNLYLQLLRDPDDLQETLRGDGWKLEPEHHDFVLARHPQVQDEGAARSRLHHLGLLTSSCLRIEFDQRLEEGVPAQS
ncbi:MAG TPA: hypothetical protein VG013_16225 [Gemmataceae bacterium]|nr:hypothetical protein [Gemmataceae bacterium]